MNSIWSLDDMLIPKIITWIYRLFLTMAVIGGIVLFFSLSGDRFGPGPFISFLLASLLVMVGVVTARIWSEMLIVQFKIHECLQDIRTK